LIQGYQLEICKAFAAKHGAEVTKELCPNGEVKVTIRGGDFAKTAAAAPSDYKV
jgi:hypothetical protein